MMTNERGVALIAVLLVALAVGVLSAGAAMVGSNARIINRYNEQYHGLVAAADAGLEEGRSLINGNDALYPDTLYNTLESGAAVRDAAGNVIPRIRRSLYVGPTGVTTGQYGVFGSIVAVVEDDWGNRVVRRGEVMQESFAKYAYFTDVEPSYISFGGGDQIQGPVHTNDYLKIYASGATFLGSVTTAKTVQGAQYGTFAQGYTEHGARIDMPQTAELDKLRSLAQVGATAFVGNAGGGDGQATTRIEFIALDLNGDGQANGDNESFIKVYQSGQAGYVVGDLPADYNQNGLRNSVTCGHYHGGTFITASNHPSNGPDSWVASVSNATRRCYLGGSDSLFGGFQPAGWLPWSGAVDPLVAARPDGAYLIPINREMNPAFKGVIFVDGKVAVSGVVRGHVTLAATDDIIIVDDLVYGTDPGAGTCRDMLGLFSGDDVVVADNAINAPVRPANGQNWFTYDDTKDEFINGVILALDLFTVDEYDRGATRAERCESRLWGRGCLYLTGGIIQRTRGAVGTIQNPGGTGYVKRYSYDQCALTTAPPYFPTTGHFVRGRYYNVDPSGFDIGQYWDLLTP